MGIFGRVDQGAAYQGGERVTPQQLRDRARVARGKSAAVQRAAEARAKLILDEAREHSRSLLAEAEDCEARAAEAEVRQGGAA